MGSKANPPLGRDGEHFMGAVIEAAADAFRTRGEALVNFAIDMPGYAAHLVSLVGDAGGASLAVADARDVALQCAASAPDGAIDLAVAADAYRRYRATHDAASPVFDRWLTGLGRAVPGASRRRQ